MEDMLYFVDFIMRKVDYLKIKDRGNMTGDGANLVKAEVELANFGWRHEMRDLLNLNRLTLLSRLILSEIIQHYYLTI